MKSNSNVSREGCRLKRRLERRKIDVGKSLTASPHTFPNRIDSLNSLAYLYTVSNALGE